MTATAFATIASLKVIDLSEDLVALFTVVEILRF